MQIFKIAIGMDLLPLRLEDAGVEEFRLCNGREHTMTINTNVYEEKQEYTIGLHYIHPCGGKLNDKFAHLGVRTIHHAEKLVLFKRDLCTHGCFYERHESQVSYFRYAFVDCYIEQLKQRVRFRDAPFRYQSQEPIPHRKKFVFLLLPSSFELLDADVSDCRKRSDQLNYQQSALYIRHLLFFLLDCQSSMNRGLEAISLRDEPINFVLLAFDQLANCPNREQAKTRGHDKRVCHVWSLLVQERDRAIENCF